MIPDHAAEAANGVWVACGEALPLGLRELLDRLVEHPQPDDAAQGRPPAAKPPDPETILPGHAMLHDTVMVASVQWRCSRRCVRERSPKA